MTTSDAENPAVRPRGRADDGGRMPAQDELPIRAQPTLFFRAVRAAVWALAHTVFSLRVSGGRELRRTLKALPEGTPVLYVSNHLSMVDGPLLEAVLPARPRVHALAAGEILTANKLRWWFVRHLGGVFPVDRGAQAGHAVDFNAVYGALSGRHPISLLGFPEGGIGPVEGKLNRRLKSGMVQFGLNSGAVEIPIGITGTTRLWFRRRIKVKIGAPIQYDAGMPVAARVARQAAAIEALIEPYQQHFGPKFAQWLFPQTRKQRATWKAQREGWNSDRLVPRYVSEGREPLTPVLAADTPPAEPRAARTGATMEERGSTRPAAGPSPERAVPTAPRPSRRDAAPGPSAGLGG